MKNLTMRYSQLLTLFAIVFVFAHAAVAADNPSDHPGYVEFAALNFLSGDQPIVEVNLKSPLLSILASFVSQEDAAAAEIMTKLQRVTVRVFDTSSHNVTQIADAMQLTANQLDTGGWDRIVELRDGSDNVDIYMKMSPDASIVHGITVMVMAPTETVLVNVVGDILPQDIASLGQRFHIGHLQNMDACQINPGDC